MPRRSTEDPLSLPVAQNDGFSTKGSLDWVGLTRSTVSFSIGVLSRCAAAGVDPYSVVVGQAIARNLPLGTLGRRNVQEALSELKSYAGLGDALWFGFSIKSFARTLGMTDQGCSLMAICSALSECYHEDLAAQVMHNIVLLYNPPGELTPSPNEWLMIVRACSGVFSATKFPVLAEGFMRLDPSSQRLTTMIDDMRTSPTGRGCPSPEDLAASILGVGKVASREYDSIAIFGCAAVGWLAAIAEWLFDLTVLIRDMEGNILYANCVDSQDARIQIVFRTGASNEGNTMEVVSKTYQLDDCSEILRTTAEDSTLTILSGRLPWQLCLSSAFGSDFDQLLSIRMNVGLAFGCAARIFKAIANAECGLDREALLCCRSYFDASSGQGFISNVLHWFPELKQLQTQMNQGVRMTLLDAKAQYEERVAAIQRHCSCDCCRNWEFDGDQDKFCLLVMFEAILVLCQVMSGMNVAENLLPMRGGFEAFYKRQLSIRRDRTIYENREQVIGPIVYVFETTSFGDWNIEENIADRRIVDALRLFTGRDIQTTSWGTAAQCENGICAYLDILREFSLDSELVGRVNVVPGQIERDHKPFRVIQDRDVQQDSVDSVLSFLGKSVFDDASIFLTETVRALNISFKVHNKSLKAGKVVQIGPADLVHTVAQARGLVSCTHRNGYRGINPEVAFDDADYPLLKFVFSDKTVYAIDCQNYGDHFLAVALMLAGSSWPKHICLLCHHECIQCSLSYAFQEEQEPFLILLRQSSNLPRGISRVHVDRS